MSEIQALELKITDNAQKAADSLDALTNVLGRLRNAVANGLNMTGAVNGIQQISEAVNRISEGAVRNVERIATALEKIGNANVGKVSKAMSDIAAASAQTQSAMQTVAQDAGTEEVRGHLAGAARAAGEAAEGVEEAGRAAHRSGLSALFASSGFSKLAQAFKRIVVYRIIRTIVKEISEGFREGINNVREYSRAIDSSFYKAMETANASILKMKNSLGAALAPALEALVPLLQTVVGWVIQAANVINQFISLLTGKDTWVRAIDVSTSALDKTKKSAGGAAKAVKNLLADFDELNIIQSQTGSGGGGIGSLASDDYKEMFETVDEYEDWIVELKDKFMDLLPIIKDIGLAFLTWEISKTLYNMLTGVNLRIFGIVAALFGLIRMMRNVKDQWDNGIDIDNMKKVLLDAAIIVGGLALAFGTTGAAIGMVIAGAGLLIAPIKELVETGTLADESLTQLTTGLLLLGGGISLLTGNWIPLLIAGVAAAAAWIYTKWDWLCENVFNPIGDFFKDIWETISGWWTSTVQPAVEQSLNNISETWTDLWENHIYPIVQWIDTNIIQPIAGFFSSLWGSIKGDEETNLASWWNGIWENNIYPKVAWIDQNITGPIGQFFTDLWTSFRDTDLVQGAIAWWNGLWGPDGWFATAINNIQTSVIDPVAEYFSSLWNNFKDSELVQNAVAWWNGLWGPEGSIASGINDINTYIVGPAGEYLGKVWDNFKESGAVQGAISWWNGLWGPEGSFAVGLKNINTNIIAPIGEYFSSLWQGFTETPVVQSAIAWWEGIWGPEGSIAKVANAVDAAVLEPIRHFFDQFWTNFSQTESGQAVIKWWEDMWSENGTFAVAASAIDTNIIQPIVGFFTGLWGSIMGDEENNIGTWWNDLWNNTFMPVVESIRTNITEPIGKAFEDAATAAQTAWNGIVNFFIDIVNGVIDCINLLINALNSIHFTIPKTTIIPAIPGLWDEVSIPEVTIGISGIGLLEKIPRRAEGGFVSTGEMFIARESGPELVGTIGGKTAVANNDQIIAGVANGVAAGQSEQNSLLRQQNDYLRRILEKQGNIKVEPSAAWGKFNKRSGEMYASNIG